MALFTINQIDGTEYDDVESATETLTVLAAIRWLSQKYDCALDRVTFDMLTQHAAIMAQLTWGMGTSITDPAATNGDDYDEAHDNLASFVMVHSVS